MDLEMTVFMAKKETEKTLRFINEEIETGQADLAIHHVKDLVLEIYRELKKEY